MKPIVKIALIVIVTAVTTAFAMMCWLINSAMSR